MNEELKSIYDIMQANNLLPKEVQFDAFSRKMGEPGELRKLYDGLAGAGAVKGTWEQFEGKVGSKKKDPTSEPSSPDSATSSSSPDVPVPPVGTPSGQSEQAPWDQVISQTQPAAPSGPRTIDLTSPEAFRNIGTEPRETAGFGKPLTGDEDPFEVAESLRATLPGYEYRKTYENKTTLRKLGRDMENLSVYGQQARKQTQAAEKRLTEKFGVGWEGGLENMTTMMEQMKQNLSMENPNDQSAYNEIVQNYNRIVGDPDFQEYQNGLKAQNKGYEAFKAYQERPEIKEKMALAAKGQIEAGYRNQQGLPEMLSPGVPGQGTGAQNWVMRKGAQLLGGAMSLPRTLGGVLPDDLKTKKWTLADEMASIGDELVESANINYPKPEQLTKPLYEKTVKFEGNTVVVDGKGKPVAVRDADGKDIKGFDEAPEGGTSLAQRFEESGKGKEASLDWNGSVATTLDKTLDAAADLLIYRYMGQGTKVGVVASSMAMQHQQAYREAIEEQKMSPADAAEYAFFSSLGNGMLEAYIGNIESTLGKSLAIKEAALSGKQVLSMAGKTGAQKAAARFGALKEIGLENVEELAQSIHSDLTRAQYNKMTGAEMEMEATKEGLAETFLITTLVTAPAAMMGMGANANQYRMSALMAAVKDPARFDALMDEFAGNGVVDETQAAMLKAKIGQLAAYNQNLPAAMSQNDRAHVLALQEYRDSQARIAESDRFVEAQRQQARQEVKKADEIINEIVTKATGVKGQEVAPEQQAVVPVNMPEQQPLPTSEDVVKPIEGAFTVHSWVWPKSVAHVAKPIEGAFPPDATIETINQPEPEEFRSTGEPPTPPVMPIEEEVARAAVEALQSKGMEVTPEVEAEAREFVVPEMTQPEMINDPAEPANQAIDRLTTEFMVEKGVEIKPVKTVEQLKEERKSVVTEMDSNLDEKGQDDTKAFFAEVGPKLSDIQQSVSTNSPEFQQFQQTNPAAAEVVQNTFTKIAALNEEIRNLERVPAQEPGQPGAIPQGADTAPVQNKVQDNTGVEVGEVEVGVEPADVQPGDTVDIYRADVPGSDKASDIIKPFNGVQKDALSDDFRELSRREDEAYENAATEMGALLVTRSNYLGNPKRHKKLSVGVISGEYSTFDPNKPHFQYEDIDGSEDAVMQHLQKKYPGRVILYAEEKRFGLKTASIIKIDDNGKIVPPQKEPDTTDRAEQLANQTPKSQEDAVSMSKEASATLAEAPLPDKPDESNVAQLVANGSMEPETAALALSDLPGAEQAGEEVMAAMADIKKDMTDERADEIETAEFTDMETAHSPEEVLDRPAFVETDTEFVVTRSTHIRDILRDMGGKWTPGRGWVFPLKMKESVLAAINRPVNPNRDVAEKRSPGLAGRLGAAMRNATIYRLASQRRNRIAKGKSLEERLRIAQDEIRIASDERVRRLARVSERLQKAFPGIEVISDPAEFAAAAKKAFPDAEIPPAGFVVEGKVYYDIERAGIDTPIHEFGHIWNTLMATHFPEQHARGLETMRGSEYEAAVREDARYAALDDAGVLDEALALAIGERGARIMNASRWERFQEFLDDVWMSMKRLLKTDPFQFTAQQYADYAAAKLLSGEELFPETSEEIARIETQAKAMFIGEKAQLSEQAKADLNAARRMEEKGHSNRDIWLATNWRRAVDGKWKFEIADAGVRVNIEPKLLEDGEVLSLGQIMQHDELFNAYPFLRDMAVIVKDDPESNYVAVVSRADGHKEPVITLNIGHKSLFSESTVLHEIQHLVQIAENFGLGASISSLERLMMSNLRLNQPDLSWSMKEWDAAEERNKRIMAATSKPVSEIYRATSGEVESRNVEARMFMDSTERRQSFPEDTEDVATEEQIVLFESGNALKMNKTPGFEQPGELLEGTTPYARAHFGSEELRNAATRNAAQQLIEIEIQQGGDRDMAIPQIAAALGLDEAFVDQMWNEADARVGKKAVRIDTSDRGKKTFKQRFETFRKRQFSFTKGLPKDVFYAAQDMEQGTQATLYLAEQYGKDLEKAIVKYIKAREQRMTRKAQQDFRQLINNVMNGKADWALLPDEIAEPARVMRATVDKLSRELLLSGAFPPTAILTVMENMGIVIDNSVDGAEFSVAISALSKPPYARSSEENLLIDAFLEKHQQAFGTYLNRSYRVHSYPDWIHNIPQDVWNRAKQYYLKKFAQERADLEAIVGRNDEKDAAKLEQLNRERYQVKSLISAITDDLDNKVAEIEAKASLPRKEGDNLDLDDLGDTLDNIKSFSERIKEELQRIGNISNADMVELNSMIGPNAQALSGYLRQLRSLNDEISALEYKMEWRLEDAATELDRVNNNLKDINRFMRQTLKEQAKSIDVLMTGGQLGAKPTTITKKRKDIPEEIRALYGEYHDPVINFTQSVMKMSQLLESQKFLNKLRSRYEGVYFFKDGKQTSEADTRIAAEGNARMAPLDGWYTTPDIARAMTDFYEQGNQSRLMELFDNYVVNYVKLGKTVLAPITVARNFWGNVSFMVANGWNPVTMYADWQKFGAYWNRASKDEWREYASDLFKRGIFGNAVNAKDVQRLRDQLGFEDAPKEDYGEFVDGKLRAFGRGVAHLPRNTFKGFQTAYQAGDEFWKVMGFENEKRRYAKAWFGKPFEELNPQQKEEVMDRAAHIVKTVLPTYSYVPRIVQSIRRTPFVGTFVAFPSEMIRVTYNGYALAIEEMKDPRTRAFGVTRAIGYSVAISAAWALMQAFKWKFGYDDDEWDDANKFVSEYQRNSMLLPLAKDKHGNMQYVNTGYTDPFSFLSKTVNAGFDDPTKPPAGRAVAMFQQMTEPFLSPELSFWTFMQLAMNKDDRGNPIRLTAFKEQTFDSEYVSSENLKRQFDFVRKKLQPGLVKSVWDAWDIYHINADKAGRIKEWDNFLLNHAFGLNVEKINPLRSFEYSMKTLMNQRNQTRASYTIVQGELNDTWKSLQDKFDEMTPEEVAAKTKSFDKEAADRLKAQYESSKSAYLRILKDAHEEATALIRLGVHPDQIRAALKEAKFSSGERNKSQNEINAIISGKYDSVILQFKKKEKY